MEASAKNSKDADRQCLLSVFLSHGVMYERGVSFELDKFYVVQFSAFLLCRPISLGIPNSGKISNTLGIRNFDPLR